MNSPMLSVEGLTGCKLNQTIRREDFDCVAVNQQTSERDPYCSRLVPLLSCHKPAISSKLRTNLTIPLRLSA
jgi:hypothetical protein